ncbi:aromatic amino acid lyase, partial [Peptoniphilus genitalis]
NNRTALLNLVENNEIKYGVTTGFGENFKKSISLKDAEKLQENIINSHATAVGDILTEEETRAIVLVILNSLGKGYSGVRLDTLERLKMILNKNIYPYAPKNGSVGYLSVEAHIIRAMVGSGKIILNNMEVESREVLGDYKLSYKEGLALISGTSSVTGLGAIAINDFIIGAKTADIIAAMTFEVLNGNVKANY